MADSRQSVIVGPSPRMQAVFDFIRVIAGGSGTVLLTGESGTGKDVIARLIHDESGRRSQPFVPVSCAILSESVIESELFGHERGAFTDALTDHRGRFEQAHGGTLFLDDIDDVPLTMQVKLLRVLQTRLVERLGGSRPIPVDVRVIAGSKHDLRSLVAAGAFRDDLFYRLNVVSIHLPPLRERREDIAPLMDHFLARFFGEHGRATPGMSPRIREAFLNYPWPGNVRELENACERIAQTCTCGRLRAGCMPIRVFLSGHAGPAAAETRATPVENGEDVSPISLDQRLQAVECDLLLSALRKTGGNKSRAADLLHIHRSTLADRLLRCGCTTPSKGTNDLELPRSA